MQWATFWTALAALAAACSSYLSYRLMRSQDAPHVIAYVRHDESRPSLLQIVVQNIGRGLAKDIVFRPSRPIPHRAFGISGDQAKPPGVMDSGPLIDGLPVLAPGETRKMVWGQIGGLQKALGDDVYITIECNYSHGLRAMSTVSRLAISSFEATDAIESELLRLVRDVKRLSDAVEGIGRALRLSSGTTRSEDSAD